MLKKISKSLSKKISKKEFLAAVKLENNAGLSTVRDYLFQNQTDIDVLLQALSVDDDSAIALAARYGNLSLLKLLMEVAKTKPNMPNQLAQQLGELALNEAAYYGHLSIVQELLNSGISANAKTRLGQTPLLLASFQGHSAIIQTLINAGADINHKSLINLNAQQTAEMNGKAEAASLLQQAGFLLAVKIGNSNDFEKNLPVYLQNPAVLDEAELLATQHQQTVILQQLKKARFLHAAEEGNVVQVQRYLKAHKNDAELLKAAIMATSPNAVEIVALLSKAQFLLAAKENDIKIILNYCQSQAQHINDRDSLGNTALMIAAAANNPKVVEELLEHGAKTKLRNPKGFTAEQLAQQKGHQAIMNLLNTADLLRFAKKGKYKEIQTILANKKDSVDITDSQGNTAMVLAALGGHFSVVELLLNHADPRIKAQALLTALKSKTILSTRVQKRIDILNFIDAAAKRDADSVARVSQFATAHPRAINDLNVSKESALLNAVKHNNLPVVKLLLNLGADIHVKDKRGYDIRQIALASNNPPLVEIFQENKRMQFLQDIANGDLQKVKEFLNENSSNEIVRTLTTVDASKNNAILLALDQNNNALSELLLDTIESLSKKNVFLDLNYTNEGKNALKLSATQGRIGWIKWLLNAGVDSQGAESEAVKNGQEEAANYIAAYPMIQERRNYNRDNSLSYHQRLKNIGLEESYPEFLDELPRANSNGNGPVYEVMQEPVTAFGFNFDRLNLLDRFRNVDTITFGPHENQVSLDFSVLDNPNVELGALIKKTVEEQEELYDIKKSVEQRKNNPVVLQEPLPELKAGDLRAKRAQFFKLGNAQTTTSSGSALKP